MKLGMPRKELDRLIASNEEIDPLLLIQIVEPLLFVLQRRVKLYHSENPPVNLLEGRKFAELLLGCSHDEDAESLCQRYPEGCSQLGYFIDTSLFRVLLNIQELGGKIMPVDGQPFSALARLALDWMDKAKPEGETDCGGCHHQSGM